MENWKIDHKDEEEVIKWEWKIKVQNSKNGKNRTSLFSQSMQEQFHSSPSSKEFLISLWSLEYHVTNSKFNTYIWEIMNN